MIFSAFSKYLSGDALEKQLNSKIFGGISMVKHMYEIHLLQSRVETKEGGQIPELELGRFQCWYNRSPSMNIDITSALFTLILTIQLPNSQYKDGASDE